MMGISRQCVLAAWLLLFLESSHSWSSQAPIISLLFAPGGFMGAMSIRHMNGKRTALGVGSSSDSNPEYPGSMINPLDEAMLNRHACKVFMRADGSASSPESPSRSDPDVVQTARHCLDMARLSPSAFNSQPYRMVLVHSPEKKLALSKVCLGPNRQRVLDSDCTVVFLADRQILKTVRRFAQFVQGSDPKHRPVQKMLLLYLTIFSSGFPIPRFLAAPCSFLLRASIGLTDWLMRKVLRICFFPSLASSETWATKQAMMVAMAYMLACSSRGLDTIPMEGINASGIRQILNIPRGRYAIPLVISTGKAAHKPEQMSIKERRYPAEEVVFDDSFGNTKQLPINNQKR